MKIVLILLLLIPFYLCGQKHSLLITSRDDHAEITKFDSGKIDDSNVSKQNLKSSNALTNISPYLPDGWTSSFFISKYNNATSGETEFLNSEELFLYMGYTNTTSLSTVDSFSIALLGESNAVIWEKRVPALEPGWWYWWYNTIYRFDPGTYQLTFVLDYRNEIAESNENDNRFTLSISVSDDPNGYVDIRPYAANEWNAPIVISKLRNAQESDKTLYNSDDLYLNFAFDNNGNVKSDSFSVEIIVDPYDTLWSWKTFPLPAKWHRWWKNYNIGKLPPGNYTLILNIDPLNELVEKDNNNNTYSYQFTVSYNSTVLANIAPRVRPGWSESLVINNFKEATTSVTVFEKSENIYAKYSFCNFDTIPVGNITCNLVIDDLHVVDSRELDWIEPDRFYWYNDISISGLSVGDHTLSLIIDADQNVPESNEDDNSITVSFKVEGKTAVKIIDNDEIQIWPNPADNILNIKGETINEYEITILNSMGQIVRSDISHGINKSSMSLVDLPSGIYVLKAQKDQVMINKEFIKN